MAATTADPVLARKKGLIYIRAILTLCLILLAAYNGTGENVNVPLIGGYLLVLLASNIVFIQMPKESYEGLRLHYIIFITDIILLSLGTYWMANLDFQFFITMFLTIFICALSRSIGFSLIVALVVNMVYLYMKSIQLGGVSLLLQDKILLNIPFLFIVALHSSYLAEKASEEEGDRKRLERSKNNLVEQVKSRDCEMEELSSFNIHVYDSFKEGVIVLDSAGVIKVFNSRAELIFNTKRGKVINYFYREARILGEVIDIMTELKARKMAAVDREVFAMIDGQNKKLIVNTAAVKGDGDVPAGMLCTVRHINQETGKESA